MKHWLAILLIALPAPADAWTLPAPIARAMALLDQPTEPCAVRCTLSPVGRLFIQQFEGPAQPVPYDDATGLPIRDWSKVRGKATVGIGHLILPAERARFTRPLTPSEMETLFDRDLATHIAIVDRAVTVPLWPLQTDSLISFEYNTGPGKCGVKDGLLVIKKTCRPSQILQAVNAEQHDRVPSLLTSGWNTSGGVKMRGLVLRREAEAALYERAKP